MAKLYILKILLCFSLLFSVSPKAGLAEVASTKVEKVFPNPASDYLFFRTDSSEKLEFEIYSLIGNKQNISFQETEKGLFRFNVEHLQPGSYFLSALNKKENRKSSYRFQKK
jgi:hypothetical protein